MHATTNAAAPPPTAPGNASGNALVGTDDPRAWAGGGIGGGRASIGASPSDAGAAKTVMSGAVGDVSCPQQYDHTTVQFTKLAAGGAHDCDETTPGEQLSEST